MKKDNLIPWGEINFISDSFELKLKDNLFLKIIRNDHEIQIYYGISQTDIKKSRFIISRKQQLFLEPCLPDLPVVIRPESNLSIMSGTVFNTFIEVPITLQITYGSVKKKKLIYEIPIRSLSRSWFGDPDSGEIAYFIDSPMDTKIISKCNAYSCIYCPVTIINKSSQILSLERMILRVPYLTIYRGDTRYYSGGTRITYRGQDQVSQIILQKTSPDIDDNLQVAALPRLEVDSGVLLKSFYFIKTLYNG
ncbi:MAG: DUF432 domain-containing protein [Spirochaetaceae bacterium]|jgi:hypothetical protein|nr:DUF432 domain-containing protein [Spirochaetaceae bacterium]